MAGLLSRDRIIAPPGFNRWLVPPAALAIQLSIGMAYGFSVFWLPLSRAVGITHSVPCPDGMSFFEHLVTTTCDWKISSLGWMFTLFFVFLGSAAAAFGRWLELVGPRKAGVVAACCWGGGFLISALGVHLHQIWLLWLGSGAIGGCGLGLGYISPVSTLIKWFPDRRGMATGMAIMGFGGGALIGAPLADRLMKAFATPTSVGVAQTFVVLGLIYFVVMLIGAFGYRLPASDWTPAGWTPAARHDAMITTGHVAVERAWRTPQFWLLWSVLCLNVSAGIGVIGIASPMIQEVFGGQLIGQSGMALRDLGETARAELATVGAAFAALLSIFNIAGRIGWASLSDRLGRKRTYVIFFALGALLYALVPTAARLGSVAFFVLLFCIILTMYGGGFATVPAYLADLYGTRFVGAIHGRLLTAWSAAGILGPVLVNYIREYQLDRGIPPAQVYNVTMYALTVLLVIGLVCNLAIRPVSERHHLPADDRQGHPAPGLPVPSGQTDAGASANWLQVGGAWLLVCAPLAWGIWTTIAKASTLFR